MNKKKVLNLLYIYILAQPFIDLATALVTRLTDFPITLGIFVRGLFIIVMTVYILFFNKSKYKKMSIVYIILLILYAITYFITKKEIFDFEYFFDEILNLFKYIYISVVFLGLLNFFSNHELDYNKLNRIFIKIVLLYSIMIILPIITNVSFSSYVVDNNVGYIGWFYSANEVGAILTILYPYLFFYVIKKNSYLAGLILVPTTLVMIFLGTKTSLLGLIIPLFLLLIYLFYKDKKEYKKSIIICVTFLIIVISSIIYMPAVNNFRKNINKNNGTVDIIMSNRQEYLIETAKIFEVANIDDQLFGIGFTNRKEINNPAISKIIEMDVHDILFRFGYIGALLLLLPFIYIIYVIFRHFSHKKKLDIQQLIYGYAVGITLMIAYMAGHVLSAPSVAIYLAISMILLIKKLDYER